MHTSQEQTMAPANMAVEPQRIKARKSEVHALKELPSAGTSAEYHMVDGYSFTFLYIIPHDCTTGDKSSTPTLA